MGKISVRNVADRNSMKEYTRSVREEEIKETMPFSTIARYKPLIPEDPGVCRVDCTARSPCRTALIPDFVADDPERPREEIVHYYWIDSPAEQDDRESADRHDSSLSFLDEEQLKETSSIKPRTPTIASCLPGTGRGRWNERVTLPKADGGGGGVAAAMFGGNLSKSILLNRSMERIDAFGGEFWFDVSIGFGERRICNSTLGGCWGASIRGWMVRKECVFRFDNESSRASVFSEIGDSSSYGEEEEMQSFHGCKSLALYLVVVAVIVRIVRFKIDTGQLRLNLGEDLLNLSRSILRAARQFLAFHRWHGWLLTQLIWFCTAMHFAMAPSLAALYHQLKSPFSKYDL